MRLRISCLYDMSNDTTTERCYGILRRSYGAICRRTVVKSHNTFPSWCHLTYHIGMKSLIASVSLILGLLPIGLGIRADQAQQAPTTVKKVPVHPTTSVAGKDLYREYCAVCHGTTGKGDGPAASALKVPP